METRAGPLLHETATRARRRQFCGRRVEGSSRPGDDTGPTPAIGVGLSACEGDAVRGDVATSNRRGVVVLPGGSKGDDSASDGAGRDGVYDAQHRADGPRERSSGTSHDRNSLNQNVLLSPESVELQNDCQSIACCECRRPCFRT